MSYPINVQSSDQWQTFQCPHTVKITGAISQIAGQATSGVLLTFGTGWPGNTWGLDETYLPQLLSLARRCDAIRVKSAAAAQPCIVTLNAIPEGEST